MLLILLFPCWFGCCCCCCVAFCPEVFMLCKLCICSRQCLGVAAKGLVLQSCGIKYRAAVGASILYFRRWRLCLRARGSTSLVRRHCSSHSHSLPWSDARLTTGVCISRLSGAPAGFCHACRPSEEAAGRCCFGGRPASGGGGPMRAVIENIKSC